MKLKPRSKDYQPEFKIKKNLNLTALLATISQNFSAIPDQRRASHRQYLQHDVLMAALSSATFLATVSATITRGSSRK